jgi:glutathione S-transferase
MKLYGFAPTRTIRALWMLRELDLDFEYVQVDLTKGDHRRPEFLAVNPAGKVPVLVDDDLVLSESVAIVLYLAEKYPQKGFLPADLRARAEVNHWLLFTATELEQPLWRIARHTHQYPIEKRLAAEIPIARQDFLDMAAVMEKHLETRPVLVGENVTSRTSSRHTRSTWRAWCICSRPCRICGRTWSGCTHGPRHRSASHRRSRASAAEERARGCYCVSEADGDPDGHQAETLGASTASNRARIARSGMLGRVQIGSYGRKWSPRRSNSSLPLSVQLGMP